MRKIIQLSLATLAFLAVAQQAAACNVPVFRYALERWNKLNVDDLYSLHIFFTAPPTAQERGEIETLQAQVEDSGKPANLAVYSIDAGSKIGDPGIAKIYEAHKAGFTSTGSTRPFMVLRFPETWGMDRPLHVGPYDRAVIAAWLDSPLRRRIARNILQGQSAVFLLIESGDAGKDKEVKDRAERELKRLGKEIELPERTDAPKDRLLRDDIPLKVSFVLLTVSRSDPGEQMLLKTIYAMGSEDKVETLNEPVLIAIYGRGIAMVENEALIGKGISPANIERIARFLIGPCSCEVRRGNPGIELLTHINWDGPPQEEAVPALTPTAASPDMADDETAGSPGTSAPLRPASAGFRVWRSLVWALGGVAILVLLGSMVIVGRRGRAL